MKLTYNCPVPNTFGLIVRAACLLEYDSVQELRALLSDEHFSAGLPLPMMHVGGGSNLLFSGDYPGTLLHSRIGFMEEGTADADGWIRIRVGSGVVWDNFCAWAALKGYWGPENLSLIPGEVGAAAVQNIGAYGREACQLIESVECLDLRTHEEVLIPVAECGYGYRASNFKSVWKGRYAVTAVTLRLSVIPRPELDYRHVRDAVIVRFGGDVGLSPKEIREVIIDIRNSKLPSPSEIGSAGSFFRNPFVTAERLAAVEAVAAKEDFGPVPHFDSDEGIKIPAAWLIEKCGWKGYHEGNVAVYDKQPLVLINANGRALPQELIQLKNKIIESVRARFGIELDPEVEIV